MYTYVCTHVCVTHMHMCMSVSICVMYIHACVCPCICVRASVCESVSVCLSVYLLSGICTLACAFEDNHGMYSYSLLFIVVVSW